MTVGCAVILNLPQRRRIYQVTWRRPGSSNGGMTRQVYFGRSFPPLRMTGVWSDSKRKRSVVLALQAKPSEGENCQPAVIYRPGKVLNLSVWLDVIMLAANADRRA